MKRILLLLLLIFSFVSTNYSITINGVKILSKNTTGYEVIEKLSDLPKPTTYGAIFLKTDTNYQIVGTINLQNYYLTSLNNSNNKIAGITAVGGEASGFLYTGTGAMIRDNGENRFWFFQEMQLIAPAGKVFQLGEGATTNGNSLVFDFGVTVASDIGSIKNYNFVTIPRLAMAASGNGILLENISFTSWENFQWTAGLNTSGTALTLQGDFQNVSITGGYTETADSEYVLDIKPTSTINTGSVLGLTYKTNGGDFYAPNSKNEEDVRWKFTGNSNIDNSQISASMNLIDNTTQTAITVTDDKYILVGTTAAANLLSFTHSDVDNRLTYIGIEDSLTTIQCNIVISGISNTNTIYNYFILKNGTEILKDDLAREIKSSRQMQTTTDVGSLSLTVNTLMSEGDYVQLVVSNSTNTKNNLTTDFQVVVHQ